MGAEQQDEIKRVMGQMRSSVKAFYNAFHLQKKEKNYLRKELETKAMFLWEHLADSTVKSISGYGFLTPDVQSKYEVQINNITEISEKLITACKKRDNED
jgi:hypothetical protein